MNSKPAIFDIEFRTFQRNIWELLAENNLCILPRRHGKSYLMAVIASFALYLAKVPIQVIVLAPTRIKARDLLFHMVRGLLESKATPFLKFNKSDLTIVNGNTGARMMFFACSEEHGSSIRGHYANIRIGDEIDEMSAREFTESALPTLQGVPPETAHIRRLILSGTPRGSTSLLTQLYAKYRSLAPDFSNIPTSTTTAESKIKLSFHQDDINEPIPQEAVDLASSSRYRVFHLPYTELGIFSDKQLQPDKLVMGDQQFRREYLVDLEATADDVLFNLADLIKTSSDYHPDLNLTPDPDGHINDPDRHIATYVPLSAGLDIGRSHDATILYIRQGACPIFLGSIRTKDRSQINNANMRTQISRIESILMRYGCRELAADAGGLGQFFVDELIDKLTPRDIMVTAIQGQNAPPYHWSNEYTNLRSCLYGLLSHSVRNHNPLPDVPLLHEELSAHTIKEQPHDKRIALAPKKEVKQKLNRSPDWSDAVAYSYYLDSQYEQDTFFATLRDLQEERVSLKDRHGRQIVTAEQLHRRYPHLLDEDYDSGSNQFFEESILNQ